MKSVGYVLGMVAACMCMAATCFGTILWEQVARREAIRPLQHASPPTGSFFYATDEARLKAFLFALPADAAKAQIMELPVADGTFMAFKVWQTPMMPGELAAKYASIKTFTAEAVDNAGITAKLDYTLYGFHTCVFDGANQWFIDPANDAPTGYYAVHYKKDETRATGERMKCGVSAQATDQGNARNGAPVGSRTSNGYDYRAYRLALSCDFEYAQTVTNEPSPSIAEVLSKMTTTMNRVNGVYERELSVTMNFVAHEDALIWPTQTGSANGPDPFVTLDALAYNCLVMNQVMCDSVIGNANYDIGHVFTTGAGGLSQIGAVCRGSTKAQSVTGQPNPMGDGFDIDYVSHEMGHEFGASHPFNNGVDGSCGTGDQINVPTAYEPGSGSTIMAYAGICKPDDLQPHSDAYFHSVNLAEIENYITTVGDGCAVKTTTGNRLVGVPPFTAGYIIPYLTPFELTAPTAVDSVNDTAVTYCWEQWNLGDVGQELLNTHYSGPIFRSYYPTKSPTRIFPEISMVLSGVLTNAGIEDAEGEKAADVARYLTFHLTVRNIIQGTGCFLVPDDTVHLDVINTGRGFTVTSQKGKGQVYEGNSKQEVTWDVVGTNTAPISADSVDVYMSADGGYTWPYHLGRYPNNGSAAITIPNPDTTINNARIKVKGAGNVFFNINGDNFKVAQDVTISLYPIPARSLIHLTTNNQSQTAIYNSIGQRVWKANVSPPGLDLPVALWARGVYIIKFVDSYNHVTVKKFVLD